MARPQHDLPAAYPLYAGEDEGRDEGYGAYRPRGTLDWRVIYTVAGAGYFAHGGGTLALAAGDLLVVRPRVPQDYGADPLGRHWHNLWVHFLPRGEMLDWLDWPTVAPGVMLLRLGDDLRGGVLADLREMTGFYRRGIGRSVDLGLNALERALLRADQHNPRSGLPRHDPRIRAAIDHLLAHLTDPPSLEAVATAAGLSRSRFAKLFLEQVGDTPGRFLELHRLHRVKRLLEHTRHSLQAIAEEMGYSSPFYLSLRFKRRFGISPRDYRLKYVNRKGAGEELR
jgi:AraC family transcriptional regulator of arabinose operon